MRRFSTTTPLRWQYTYGQALRITGPELRTTTKRSTVNQNKGTKTDRQFLPMALRIVNPALNLPLNDCVRATAPGKLEEGVTAVEDSEHQTKIENEAGLIEEAGPYFFQVAKYLLPNILTSLGLTGELKFPTEHSQSKDSTPDKIVRYNGKNILVLDYKGPNCIVVDELELSSADSIDDAHSKFETIKFTEKDEERTRQRSLILNPNVNKSTVRLIKQGIKYAHDSGASTVLFYDYENLIALDVPEGLHSGKIDVLMNMAIWTETVKSKKGNLIPMENNHVAVLINYIIWAIQKAQAEAGENQIA